MYSLSIELCPLTRNPQAVPLPATHLWLLCEGLNYLQTALKSQDERHGISAKYCYSDMEFNDPLQFIRKMHFAVMGGNVST